MLYAIAANIVFNITLFSFGIAVLQDKAKPDIKGILLNPCLICTVVALVLYALPFRFPTPIMHVSDGRFYDDRRWPCS